MLLIVLSCLLSPWLSAMSVNVLTPEPPVHVHVVFHATVDPHSVASDAQSEPALAPDVPHWSSRSEYGPAATLSHWPQCAVVSTAVHVDAGALALEVWLLTVEDELGFGVLVLPGALLALPGRHCDCKGGEQGAGGQDDRRRLT
jgi:hypothetical protein